MVWKLLKKNISAGQIAGYAIANLIGLAIVIGAVKFYSDISSTWNDDDSFIKKDFLIISKKVSTLNTVGISKNSTDFSPEDIKELEAQPWVRKVGQFSSANFNIMAALDIEGRSMSTYIFFEAIPDEFLDIAPGEWRFNPSSGVVPIIMSKDYLTLYNFGFAATRNMPQLSETLMSRVPMTVTLSGNGRHETFRAHIVGFSSRLNTIAVPEDFLNWANERFSDMPAPNPSRLVIEVNTPGDPAIQKYFDKNGYEVAGDKTDNSNAAYFLTVVTTIVLSIGVIISLLAFFILTLSIFLLLQKNKQKLHDLMLLGYSPAQVAKSYYILIGLVNLGVLILASATALLASTYWMPRLAEMGIVGSSPWLALGIGTLLILVVTALNFLSIRRIVGRNFYNA